MATEVVLMMSVKPAMMVGNGPRPTTMRGPLTIVMDWAGAWIAMLLLVSVLMLPVIWTAVRAAEMGEARARVAVKKLRKETILTVVNEFSCKECLNVVAKAGSEKWRWS